MYILLQVTFILQSNLTTADGFVQTVTLGFEEGSVIGIFAIDYMPSSSVTEIDIYNVLNSEVETGMLTDGVDYLMVSSLSSVEGKIFTFISLFALLLFVIYIQYGLFEYGLKYGLKRKLLALYFDISDLFLYYC